MTSKQLIVLVLALCTWANAPGLAAPFKVQSTPTMPPARIQDCVTYVLLDNKCTADWYKCSADRTTCTRAWNDCCRLPGNTARTTIVTAPQTP